MYSVFRVTHENISLPLIDKIGNEMNLLKEGVYKGIRKAKDGFACEISEASLWKEHIQEIIAFLHLFRNQITELEKNNYEIVVDVAIELTDFSNDGIGLFLFHDIDFIKVLEQSKVNYEISLYIDPKNCLE